MRKGDSDRRDNNMTVIGFILICIWIISSVATIVFTIQPGKEKRMYCACIVNVIIFLLAMAVQISRVFLHSDWLGIEIIMVSIIIEMIATIFMDWMEIRRMDRRR